MRSLLLLCLCAIATPGLSSSGPLDLYVVPDRPESGDPVVILLFGDFDPSCTQIDSVVCSRTDSYRLEMNVLIVETQERCFAIHERYAKTCVFDDLLWGDYTVVAKIFTDDLSGAPAFVDSLSFSVKLPTGTRESSWGQIRGMFR